jgi:hypothetical protein
LTNLLKVFSFILFLLLLTSTDFKDYYLLINEGKYVKLSLKGDKEILKRSIVFSSIRKPSDNPHLEKNESTKTSFFVYLVKKKKYSRLANFLQQHNNQLNIHHFYVGLDYFMRGLYSKAEKELNQYNEDYLKYYKYLLLADCLYEQKGYSLKTELIEAYQKALDASSGKLQEEIVKNRVKYIAYKK